MPVSSASYQMCIRDRTTTLQRTIEALKEELKIGIMEADIDSDVDARTIENMGVKVIQLHTCLLYTSRCV